MTGNAVILEPLQRWLRSPLAWVVCAAVVMRLAGIGWGLPASDGWDDDGVAPRNFLTGLALTYTPGSHFTYPPLHMILLAVLTAPGSLIALFHAASLTQHDLIAEMIRVPYMTFFAVVARLVGIVMSGGTIYLIAKITETVSGNRAGLFAAATCTLNAALTYYGQVTNLDGPSLFWSALSVLGWMRAICEHEPRHMRWAALAAAASVATKDQTYAVFVLAVPLGLLAWFVLDRWPRRHWRAVAATFLLSTLTAAILLLMVDGAVTNPTGFADRIAFLTGPASRDYAQYQPDWSGRLALVMDMWAVFPRYYPAITLLLAAFGAAALGLRLGRDHPRFVAATLPLLVIVSFTVAFNFVALRTETRFLLPQSVFIAVYVGVAADKLLFATRPWLRIAARVMIPAIAALAFHQCASVVAAFVMDPRYDAERWLDARVRKGDVVETYGQNAFLPRFPEKAVVTRIGQTALKARNPLPNVAEIEQPYDALAARSPHFIIVSDFWVRDFLAKIPPPAGEGRVVQRVRQFDLADVKARAYFRALFDGRLGYRLAHKSEYEPALWSPLNAYESLTQTIWIFERGPARGSSPSGVAP